MLRTFIPIIIASLLVGIAATCQPYYFRHYQVENGLSHNTVFCTTQDKNGFIWFGTKDGLNRFDGYRFKTFDVIKDERGSLKRDLILSLATDSKGTVWVGTQSGLFYFDAIRERFIPFLDIKQGINDIFFNSKGELWFIANFSVNCYNFVTRKFIVFPPKKFFQASSLCETSDGTMWFSTRAGYLQRFDALTGKFEGYNVFQHSPPAESKVIQKIVFNSKGTILIGTSNQGIKEFHLDRLDYTDIVTYNPDKTTIYVHDILQVSSQETWFATESGIFIRNNSSGKFLHLKKRSLDPYSLSDNAIYTLYKDREGGIWAGTFFGGVNYYPKQYAIFQKYFPDYSKNSINGHAVREICEDRYGNIWIGTEDAGLNKLNPKTGLVSHFEPTGKPGSISYYNIHGLLVINDEVWIGTFEHGLNILDIKTGTVKKRYVARDDTNSLKNNFIVSLIQSSNGNVYLGTAMGIYQYNRRNDNFLYLKDIADGAFIACMLEDSAGNIWVATHNRGLFYFNPLTGAKRQFKNEPGNVRSLANNSINSLYEDTHRNLWIATEGGGLCRLEKTRREFTSYSTKEGLPSNFIFKVIEDGKNTLWITTSKGLVNMDYFKGKLKVYTKGNGLLNDQFNYNSGYKDKQGNLYFGSVQGLIKFNPEEFHHEQYLSPVYITGLQVQNKEIEIAPDSSILSRSIIYTSKILLPYNQSSFSIDFAALRFTSPETTEYSYIMTGVDREWTFLKSNRKVYYTNLEPGTYTFKVKAGSNGTWNQNTKELIFTISPPFWATTWAYLFYILITLTGIYYIIRTYHRVLKNKKEKEIYEAKIDFFTNIAHEIKTPLTLIKGPVENLSEMTTLLPAIKDDVNTMERNTDRLLNLINQILDFRETETKGFSLDFSDVNINDILQEAYVTFKPVAKKRNLTYKLEVPSANIFIMADAEALTKIFHNLFSNAVKYALTEVTAKLLHPNVDEERLMFEISNDGAVIPVEMRKKIFEPFFRIKDTNKQKGTGLGLALAHSLVELHKGKVYLKDNQATCNIFVVELPYASSQNKRRNTTEKSKKVIDS